jgi:DeoR family transcriptional regulator, fructose operon transcriptional repressor
MAMSGSVDAEMRREKLVALLAENGQVLLGEAAQLWDIHPMTIRRDFDYLQRSGLARRVRGGLMAISADGFAERRSLNLAAKNAIAQKLVNLVRPGATIGLDSSTTIFPLAPLLPDGLGLTVVTNGLEAFDVLQGRPGIRSYLTGGEREEKNVSLVGALAIQSLGNFHFDYCFVSALSVHSDMGTSENTLEQAAVKDAMVRASEQVVVGVDASKLETYSRVRSLTWDRVDVLVTELNPSDSRLDAYRGWVSTII